MRVTWCGDRRVECVPVTNENDRFHPARQRAKIDAELLELESKGVWQKNPNRHSSGITSSVFVMMSRKFAPAKERLKSPIAWERRYRQKLRGSQFTIQEFHDSFMKQGFPPIKIVRRAMLRNDSPAL